MRHRLTYERLQEARGLPVYDAGGERIGELVDILCDERTKEPRWIAIAAGPLGMKRVFAPVRRGALIGNGYTVPYSKTEVENSSVAAEHGLPPETAAQLASYFCAVQADAGSGGPGDDHSRRP